MPLNNYGLCGPHGRSAQPDEHGFAIATALGYNQILKLNTNDEFSDSIENHVFIPGNIWHSPMNSFKPNETQVRGLIDEMQLLGTTSKLLIHCTHGRDRTGFVCAAWRILVNKWPLEKAWDEMKQYGWTPFSSLTDSAIYDVLKKLAKG